jgi:hypothetical protein
MKRQQLNRLVRQAKSMGYRNPVHANRNMVAQIYDSINRAVFGGVLKRPQIILGTYPDMWGECEGLHRAHRHGETYTKCIRVNRHWPNMKKLINVIAHEMVHQWEWERLGTMTHGNSFWAWQERMANRGVRLYAML